MSTGASPTVHDETVSIRGVDLYSRIVGDGPDVIVLHGGPGAHHDYLLPQYDRLAAGRRLRYYDQRGGGRSAVGRDVPVGWEEHVADLAALIDHWAVAPATLLGYSWGGLLSLLCAIHHPGRVGRLALVAPASITASGRADFERRFEERMRSSEIRERRARLQASGLKERDPEAYRRRTFALSVAPYFADLDRAGDLTPFRVTARTQQEAWHSLGAYDLTEEVARLSLPALVVHGRHDPLPLSSSELTARLLRARLEVLEHSGHAPHVEETPRFAAVLDGFLPQAR